MMRIKNKTGIMCIITSVVIAMSLLLCWNNYSGAATTGRKYWKYTYESNKYDESNYSSYYLDELPIVDNVPQTRSLAYIERPNAPLEQQVVYITDANNGNFIGTGFIIGDHEIMTVAHNVTNPTTKECWNIKAFIPTANPSNGINISLMPEFMTVPDGFFNNVPGSDYAIIKVKKDLSSYGQVFLGLGTDESIGNTPVHILGYDFITGKPILKITDGYINNAGNSISDVVYRCSAELYDGTSGGPLYSQCTFGVPGSTNSTQQVQTYKTVVGIAVGAWEGNKALATRIIPEILQFAYDNEYL